MTDISKIDFHSPTWGEIKTWANEQINSARLQIEAEGLDPVKTEFQRGRIRTLKNLLALADPQPDMPRSNSPYTG